MPSITPNFFIVGAPKSATTALTAYLDKHPDICLALRKEVHHFGSDLYIKSKVKSRSEYLALFDRCKGECCIGDSSVLYLISENAAQEIFDFAPDAKIIIMLRNPVDVIYSLYYQMLFDGDETLPTFEQGLAAEDERVANKTTQTVWYRRMVRYTDQVKRYFDAFGREQVHVIIYDDLQADTTKVYRETLEFLQVDTNFQPDFRVVNANSRIRSAYVRDFIKNPPRWYSATRNSLRKFISPTLRRKVNVWIKEANSIYESRPPLNPELRSQLQQEYQAEVEQLSQLLGRDLTYWSHS